MRVCVAWCRSIVQILSRMDGIAKDKRKLRAKFKINKKVTLDTSDANHIQLKFMSKSEDGDMEATGDTYQLRQLLRQTCRGRWDTAKKAYCISSAFLGTAIDELVSDGCMTLTVMGHSGKVWCEHQTTWRALTLPRSHVLSSHRVS
jgi:hypothetical protein